MTAPYRTSAGGRIDRGTRYEFTFDGRTFAGHRGDTLASAVLANGVHNIATSVKFGRQRGISAGWVERSGLATSQLLPALVDLKTTWQP